MTAQSWNTYITAILDVTYLLIIKNIRSINLLSSFIAKKQVNIEESKTGADAWRLTVTSSQVNSYLGTHITQALFTSKKQYAAIYISHIEQNQDNK